MTHNGNHCEYCGAKIGQLERQHLDADDKTCPGCGRDAKEALRLEDRYMHICPHCGKIAITRDIEDIDCPERT
jgi:predicted RNA-binding Zn-ribbon protein involved in translation (DUF1610 family)